MNFQVRDGEKYHKILEIEILPEEMEPALNNAYKRLLKQVNIPGFRKGKIPRAVLESYLGKDALLQEASEELMNNAYAEGLKANDLVPCDSPEVEITKMSAGESLCFNADVIVYPEVKLGEYKGLSATRRILEVDDEDIDEALEEMQERLASYEDAEEGAVADRGDTAIINYKGIKDGVAFEGGTDTNSSLELGSNRFIPGFEQNIINMRVGDERTFPITFPETYHEPSLAGQEVTFEVQLVGLKKKRIPELDQAFVEQASETAENMDQLREEVKQKLLLQGQDEATSQARNNIMMEVVGNSEIDIPPILIEQQLDTIIETMSRELMSQGLSIDEYLRQTDTTMETLRDLYVEQATFTVKSELVLNEIMKQEEITLSPEELEKEFDKVGELYNLTSEQIQMVLAQNGRTEEFVDNLRMQHVAQKVYEWSNITDEDVSKAEYTQDAMDKAFLEEQLDMLAKKKAEDEAKANNEEADTTEAEDAPAVEAEVKDEE